MKTIILLALLISPAFAEPRHHDLPDICIVEHQVGVTRGLTDTEVLREHPLAYRTDCYFSDNTALNDYREHRFDGEPWHEDWRHQWFKLGVAPPAWAR